MQCKAHRKSGIQCKNQGIPGGTVCRYHGGAAPQVQRVAQERLAALVEPSITRLGKLVRRSSDAVGLGAVKDVLDRAGYKATERVEQLNYTPEDVENLSNLTDKQLQDYIELRRIVTSPKNAN